MKLTSLAAAAILWAVVAAQEPRSQLIPVTLNINVPNGRALAEDPPVVEAMVTGPGRELFKLYASPPYIDVTVPDGPAAEHQIDLALQNLRYATSAAVVVQDLEPRQVTVRLDSVTTKTVSVFANATVTPDTGFQLVGDPAVSPSSVVITGTRTQLDGISGVSTEPFVREGARATVRTTLAIDTTGLSSVRISHYEVSLAAVVVEVTTRVLQNVRVVPIDADRESVTVDPANVLVTIRGPADRIESMTADSLSVTAGTPSDSTGTVVLTVRAPPGISATAEPPRVTIRPNR